MAYLGQKISLALPTLHTLIRSDTTLYKLVLQQQLYYLLPNLEEIPI